MASNVSTLAADSLLQVASAPLKYQSRLANLATEREDILALWQSGLSQHGMAAAKFHWYYAHNPEGPPLVALLDSCSACAVVGVAAVGPRKMRFDGVTIPVGALVDFVLEAGHRTFFPALFLQKEIARHAKGEFEILFGFPNAKSLAIVRRAGHQCVGQMYRRTRVLRAATYLTRYLPGRASAIAGASIDALRMALMAASAVARPGFQSQWQSGPDDTFDELWRRTAGASVLMGVRDRAYLAWRFVDVPAKTFRFFTLTTSASPRLAAYAVCEAEGAAMNVVDFLVDPGLPSASSRLWLDLSREATRLGHSSLSVEFLGPVSEQKRLHDAGFLIREHCPVYAMITVPQTSGETYPMDESSWYLTSADRDW